MAGYGEMSVWTKAAAGLAMLAILPALLSTWRNRTSLAERSFWLVLFASILLSAAIVYADAGWRALHVTNIFVACFLASAFGVAGAIAVRPVAARHRQWQIGAVSIAAAAVLAILAPVLSRAQAMLEIAAHPAFTPLAANEQVVLGGRAITGFLVVPDGSARPISVPALHASDFINLLRLGGIEGDFGPAQALVERAPFALVWSPRIDQQDPSSIFLAPPGILLEPDAWAWRLTMGERPRSENPGVVWKEAVAVQRLR